MFTWYQQVVPDPAEVPPVIADQMDDLVYEDWGART